MDRKLPNSYIAQAISGACLLTAGAVSTMVVGDMLIYLVCALVELWLLSLMIRAIKRRDTPYIYTMAGTMICIAALAILIGNIINKMEALA